MGIRAAVAGASGYAGGELLRLLLAHPDIDPVVLAAGERAGTCVGDVHPHLPALAGERFVATTPEALAGADVVFLALPHGASGALDLDAPLVVDLGADHRLADPAAWERWYGGPYAGAWPYGLPELPGTRAALAEANRIAVPGCYPTAVTLALAPLVAAGLVETDDVVVVAASGTSGAGRAAKASLLGSEVMGDLSAYKVAAHQHTPEIAQAIGVARLSFTTVLAPMPRGILATCTARTSAPLADLRAALDAAYRAEPFVHLLPEGRWPHTAATAGSNACHLQVATDGTRAVVVSAIDNLGKGAAGQAVQCANLALGLPETTGLTANGVAP
jgi:N-acetyl-gamma-glutamyl-phosphate reductase